MSGTVLFLLSLGVSVAMAGAALAVGVGVERLGADARLRDRLWGALLLLPLIPPATAALALLLLPRPVVELTAPAASAAALDAPKTAAPVETIPTVAPSLDPALLIAGLVLLVLGMTLVALVRLGVRALRLARLTATAVAPPDTLRDAVVAAARQLGAPTPLVRLSASAPEPLLTGLRRPRLILPEQFQLDSPAGAAVLGHELAHLRRRDHHAIWLEEAVGVLCAFNPLVPLIRARRAAAREEACDALALAGAAPETRRAYARSLLEALRAHSSPVASLPALTFTGTPRSQAMRRLQAIVSPPPAARRGLATCVAAGFAGLAIVAATAGVGLAHSRAPVTVVAPAPQAAASGEWTRRYTEAGARDFQLYCAAPAGNPDRMLGCDANLWMAAEREQRAPTGAFCPPAADEAGLARIANEGRPHVLAAGRVSGTAGDAARQALIAAFPCSGAARAPDAGRLAARGEALTAAWEAARGADSAAEQASRNARIRALTAAQLRDQCLDGDGLAQAECDGAIFGVTIRESNRSPSQRAFCAPEGVNLPRDYIDRVRAAMPGTPASAGEAHQPWLTRVIARAYPCTA
ncbi:MAG: M56 family metallopeptidase [Brevundimonas sp.]|jgi:beta-lactamase regulating signal transducer with metallopeptidase domain|uniref:M56 family metallopeptidase n=1 Tax=Brevundimonas sp. TaxID=1871086 RepID=UPI00391A3A72